MELSKCPANARVLVRAYVLEDSLTAEQATSLENHAVTCSRCVAIFKEIAEAYIMGRLTAEEVAAFENHYVGCNRCVMVLNKAAEYLESKRGAAGQKFRPEWEN